MCLRKATISASSSPGQHRRARVLQPHRRILHRVAAAPFGDGPRTDPMAGSELPQARLTILYYSADCLSRRGAAVKYLSITRPPWRLQHNEPRFRGTRHLGSHAIFYAELLGCNSKEGNLDGWRRSPASSARAAPHRPAAASGSVRSSAAPQSLNTPAARSPRTPNVDEQQPRA